jgi:hypothetical protein
MKRPLEPPEPNRRVSPKLDIVALSTAEDSILMAIMLRLDRRGRSTLACAGRMFHALKLQGHAERLWEHQPSGSSAFANIVWPVVEVMVPFRDCSFLDRSRMEPKQAYAAWSVVNEVMRQRVELIEAAWFSAAVPPSTRAKLLAIEQRYQRVRRGDVLPAAGDGMQALRSYGTRSFEYVNQICWERRSGISLDEALPLVHALVQRRVDAVPEFKFDIAWRGSYFTRPTARMLRSAGLATHFEYRVGGV